MRKVNSYRIQVRTPAGLSTVVTVWGKTEFEQVFAYSLFVATKFRNPVAVAQYWDPTHALRKVLYNACSVAVLSGRMLCSSAEYAQRILCAVQRMLCSGAR